MQKQIQMLGSRLSLTGCGYHLGPVYGKLAVGSRQTNLAQIRYRSGNLPIRVAGEKEEIVVFHRQLGHFAPIDGVSVGDNQAFSGLAEDLGKAYGSQSPRIQQITQHVSRPHGGKLIGITDYDQSCPRLNRL